MTGTILTVVAGDGTRTRPARERREADRALAYWQHKAARFGRPPTVSELNLSELAEGEWAHRFLIAADAVVENYALLSYGGQFARLLGLPANAVPHVPLVRQLPDRYVGVFVRGCGDALMHQLPARVEGSVAGEGGRTELYRAVFIPVPAPAGSLTSLVFGAFNCRTADLVGPPDPLRVSFGASFEVGGGREGDAPIETWSMALDR